MWMYNFTLEDKRYNVVVEQDKNDLHSYWHKQYNDRCRAERPELDFLYL